MAIFTEPYLRTIFPFDSPAGRIVVTFVLTLLPLLYAWVRIRPMDDSEPDTVLGMDAKRLALVTVSLALGAVVFVILGSAFLQPSYDRVCDCNWIADDGRYETMSVYSEYPPTAWIMPLFFVPFGMCAAMVSVHILKRARSVAGNRSGLRSIGVWWWWFITVNVAFWSLWEVLMTRSFGNGPENLGPTPIFLLGENHHIFGSYFYFFSGCFCALFGWLAMIPESKDRRRLDLPGMLSGLRLHAASAAFCVFQGIHYLIIYERPPWYRELVGGDDSWWVNRSALGVNETILILSQILWGVLVWTYLAQAVPDELTASEVTASS